METHGVEAARLATPLTAATLQQGGKAASAFTAKFLNVLPFIALGLAYLATQYAAYLKVSIELCQACTSLISSRISADRSRLFGCMACALSNKTWLQEDLLGRVEEFGVGAR